MTRGPVISAVLAALLLAPAAASAQTYGGQSPPAADQSAGEDGADADRRGPAARRSVVQPYIEIAQIVSWQVSPGNDVVTYTQLAAGVDASIQGRNNGASVALRYERNIGYGDAADSDSLTGLARGYATVVPDLLTVEAGALAARTSVDQPGAGGPAPFADDDLTSRAYAVYAGPNLATRIGDAELTANYRIGYTRVETPAPAAPGGIAIDSFDESVTQSASARIGTRPFEPLPVGIGIGAGFFQEDIDTLDQRVRDLYVRGDVTVPVSPTLALVGGIGVEDVEVSSRDAVRNAAGVPIVGPDGRLVTDEGSPRRIAFEADGLIWDVGVVWRPSRRTALEAHFGRRYDSETFYGNFTWQPDRISTFAVSVYDGISGFGGRLTNALAALPTDFEVIRDPLTGEIVGCVGGIGTGSCLDGAIGAVRSSVFRSRGVALNYSRQFGRTTAGLGAGYDRRSFIGAPGTVLAAADGVVDETVYLTGGISGPLSRDSSYSITTYATWFDSGFADFGDSFAFGGAAGYNRYLTRSLSARAALAFNYLDSELTAQDIATISALVGLRYDF